MSSLPHAPASLRNRQAIWEVIVPFIASGDHLLEIASGTGEHIEYMAQQRSDVTWQPSDAQQNILWAIDERLQSFDHVYPALNIDVRTAEWHTLQYDSLLCINMIHIAPWQACVSLFSHAHPRKYLILYGPFKEHGVHNSQGNIQFDATLKAQHPDWGIRDIDDLKTLADTHGFTLSARCAMPANNQTLIWSRDLAH